MLESGFRISDLENIPVHNSDCAFKNKIALDNTFILSYSHSVYGINYNRQNYKISLNTLREDLKGYIGIESIVSPWSEQLKFWHGSWNSADRNKSYVYEWSVNDKNDVHYTPEKFNDLENSYYIISDAPFPFETADLNNRDRGEISSSEISEGTAYCNNSINTPIQAADPYPDSKKIVTKSYIDERLASKRLVEVTTDFYVRDYDCTYIIRAEELQKADFDKVIKVHFPESYNKRSLHNKLEFTLLVEGKWNEAAGVWVPTIEDSISWEIRDFNGDEITPMWLNSARPEINDEYLYSNARYLVFRFETITSDISAVPVKEKVEAGDIVTAYDVTANYDVTILCENFLYRNTGIERVNDKEGTHLDIVSAKNTIIPTTKVEGSKIIVNLETDIRSSDSSVNIVKPTASKKYWDLSVDIPDTTDIQSTDKTVSITKPNATTPYWDLSVGLTDTTDIRSTDNSVTVSKSNGTEHYWDLSVDIPEPTPIPKSRIKKLPETLYVLEANGNVYWTDTQNPSVNLSFDNFYGSDEVVTFKLLYYVTEDSTKIVSEQIDWAMTDGNSSPVFIKDRLYVITVTNFSYCDSSPFSSLTSLGRIDYFIPSSKIEWEPQS